MSGLYLSLILIFSVAIGRSFSDQKNYLGKSATTIISGFFIISFFIRPLYLWVLSPTNIFLLADSRISQYGNKLLDQSLQICLLQVSAIFATIKILSSLQNIGERKIAGTIDKSNGKFEIEKIWCYFLPFEFISAIALSFDRQNLWGATFVFGNLGIFTFYLFTNFKDRKNWKWLFIVSVWEIYAGIFLVQSKFELYLPIFAILARYLRVKRLRRGLIQIVVVCLLFLTSFATVQNLINKGFTYQRSAAISQSESNAFNRILYFSTITLLERFDGFTSVIDVAANPDIHLVTPVAQLNNFIRAALPIGPFIANGQSTAQQWGNQYRGLRPDSKGRLTSVAFGPGAEGYSLAGTTGVIINSIIWAFMFWFVFGYLAIRSQSGLLYAIAILCTNNAVFENGLVSFASAINKANQCLLFFWIIRYFQTRKNDIKLNSVDFEV